MVSPGPHKHCNANKRTALGDITNGIAEEIQQGGKGKMAKKPAFAIFEEKAPTQKPTTSKQSDAKKSKLSERTVLSEQKQSPKDLGYRDIDAEITDPALSPEYANEIFINLKERELHFSVGDYMPRQTDLNITMRAILIDWLVEVQETFELFHETLYLAVRMVDRYLDLKECKKMNLQLLGVTALFLASKMEERYPPPLEDFIFVCDAAYTDAQILKMERVLCADLEYEVYMPHSYSFLRRYGKCINADMRQLTIGRYALELSLQEYGYVTKRPSQLAAAALLFSMRKGGGEKQEWDSTCQHYTGYKETELEELVHMMDQSSIKAPEDRHCKNIYKKYSHQVFFKVALLPPLSSST